MTTIDIAIDTEPAVGLKVAIDGCPERVSYLLLFGALALAEAGALGDPDIAQRAIEQQVVGWDLGLAAFGSIYPGYEDIRFAAKDLEVVVALARALMALKRPDASTGGAA